MGVALPGTKALSSGLPEGRGSKPAESLERLEHIQTHGTQTLLGKERNSSPIGGDAAQPSRGIPHPVMEGAAGA